MPGLKGDDPTLSAAVAAHVLVVLAGLVVSVVYLGPWSALIAVAVTLFWVGWAQNRANAIRGKNLMEGGPKPWPVQANVPPATQSPIRSVPSERP